MTKTDFKQIGFAEPRDIDNSIYSADINAAYGAIQSIQETMNMKTELKTVTLVRKPYYANSTTYNYRYYELPISNYFFLVSGLTVKVGDVVQSSSSYTVVQNNAILFNSDQAASAIVSVVGSFGIADSERLNNIEKNATNQETEIKNIKNGVTTVPNAEKSTKVQAKDGAFKALSIALLEMVYPVGSIYMSAVSTNPSTFLGGEWVQWGAGRVPVGVNTSDNDFNASEKMGGSKSTTLTVEQMPSHNHTQNPHSHTQVSHNHTYMDRGVDNDYKTNQSDAYNWRAYQDEVQYHGQVTSTVQPKINETTATNNPAGGGQPFSLVQPYITCYMFKRIN